MSSFVAGHSRSLRVFALLLLSLSFVACSGGGSPANNNNDNTNRNTAPLADAGPDATTLVGQTVTLDGTGSSDPDGDALTFAWTVDSAPAGSVAALSSATAQQPTFTIDVAGTYVFGLVVNDGTTNSAPDTVEVTTDNSAPVANAGADQTVFVGDTVTLDATDSTDVDGDMLVFQWSLSEVPPGSAATLSENTALMPDFFVDLPGTYVGELVVNDGEFDSAPDTVRIDTLNSAPVANAGLDQTVLVGALVELDGSGSSDADNDPLNFLWDLTGVPTGSSAALSNNAVERPMFTADQPGTYTASLVVNDGQLDSAADIVLVATENSAPVAKAGDDINAFVGQTVTLDGSSSADADNDPLTYAWSLLSVAPGSGTTLVNEDTASPSFDADVEGLYVAQLIVNDGTVDSDPDTTTIDVLADDDADGDGLTAAEEIAIGTDPNAPDTDNDGLDDGDEVFTFGTSPILVDSDGDGAGDGDEVDAGTDPLDENDTPPGSPPPDPSTSAPLLDSGTVTALGPSTDFLYTGLDPVQTGVPPGTIDPDNVVVLRGLVLNRDGTPLPNVTVSIHQRPEFGQTLSRADGVFDLAANGGSTLIVNYEKDGLLPAQRKVQAPAQEFIDVPDVALIPLDPQVTNIDLTTGTPQVAQGSVVTDDDGTRQTTILVPAGTTAEMVMPDGSTQPITSLAMRSTEYTVGEGGPTAMPGDLPPTSGYTYATELSVDQAIAADATEVRFSRPLPVYVDNFLGFPVGTPVPAGYYDREEGRWIASDNGLVIEVVGATANLADIDVDGDGAADTGTPLDDLGIDDAERGQLATLYTAGTTLWRVPTPHFTPWDYNWPYGPPDDAEPPDVEPSREDNLLEDGSCTVSGSIIECQNQVLGEAVSVLDTPFSLNYRSNRTPGRSANRTIDVELSDASVPASLRGISLTVSVAGQRHRQRFAPDPNQSTSFTWDGLDVYGRKVQGTQLALVRIGYVYEAEYQEPGDFERSFGQFGGAAFSGNRSRQTVTISRTFRAPVGGWDATGMGFGGWTLNAHHAYDPIGRTLYLGDGSQRSAEGVGPVANVVYQQREFGADCCLRITHVNVAPDGTAYFAVSERGSSLGDYIERVTEDGSSERVLTSPGIRAMAFGPDGSLYIHTTTSNVGEFSGIRILTPGGDLLQILDNDALPSDDVCNADGLSGMAVGPDDSIYYASQFFNNICQIDPEGVRTRIAGDGTRTINGDGGPAIDASLGRTGALALGPDGSLYVVIRDSGGVNVLIRRIAPDGIIATVAGNGQRGVTADGLPAIGNPIGISGNIAVGPNGNLFFAESARIRQVGADGILTTAAGGQTCEDDSLDDDDDGKAARALCWSGDAQMDIGPDGSLFFSRLVDDRDLGAETIRILKISGAFPGLASSYEIASKNGSEVFVFDSTGRHLQTLDGITRTVVYDFTYGPDQLLTAITDSFGNITTIERSGDGAPLAIEGPFGARMTLGLDANGFLSSIANPLADTYSFAYSTDGLLQQTTDPRGGISSYTHDALGRLVLAEDRANGSESLARSGESDDYDVLRTTQLGETYTYSVELLGGGAERLIETGPDELQTVTVKNPDLSGTLARPDGTVVALQQDIDPRLGSDTTYISNAIVTLPSGLEQVTQVSRTAVPADPLDPVPFLSTTETTTMNGETAQVTTDFLARTVTLTSPEGRNSGMTFDAFSRPTAVTSAGIAPTTLVYEADGGLQSITTGSGASARVVAFSQDAEGRLAQIINPAGQVMEYSYDAAGRRATSTRPDGNVVQFEWDGNGDMLSVTPPGRPAWSFTYDERSTLTSIVPPALPGTGSINYVMDADGRVVAEERPNGDVATTAYDAFGRVASRTVTSTGQPDAVFTRTYDAVSRLTGEGAPNGVNVSYAHDGPYVTDTQWTGPVAGTYSQTLGNDLRLATDSVNGGATIAYTRDRDGFLTGVGDMMLERDATTGALAGMTLGVVQEQYTRDEFGGLVQVDTDTGGTNLAYSAVYTRDALGRIETMVETIDGVAQTFAYTYDNLNRLETVTRDSVLVEQYGYDLNGNRTTATLAGPQVASTYDVQDRIQTRGAVSYTHNANGELVSVDDGGAVTTYGYNGFAILESVSLPDGTEVSYVVDSRGRRIGKSVDGVLQQGFIYGSSDHIVAELDGSGAIVSRFIYAEDMTPVWMERGGEKFRIVSDDVGSVRLVISATSGAVVQRLDYDAFGNITQDTNPGFQPFGFAGGIQDADTGLVRFGIREYDPVTGRFTTRDPVLFGSGYSNLYTYTGNDPVNGRDPYGLSDEGGWSWKNQTAGIAVGIVEGLWNTLEYTGIPKQADQVFSSWAQIFDDLGLINYDGSNVGLMLELTGLDSHVDHTSWEFSVTRVCASFLTGAARSSAIKPKWEQWERARIQNQAWEKLSKWKAERMYRVAVRKVEIQMGLRPAAQRANSSETLDWRQAQRLPTFGATPGTPNVGGYNGAAKVW